MSTATFEDVSANLGRVWPAPQPVPTASVDADALDCWSVTSILRSLYSYGLEAWKLGQVATTAYGRRDVLDALDEREAVAWLTRQDNWKRREHELSDADCGREVHRALEAAVLTDSRDVATHPEAAPFVEQFYRWLDTFKPSFLAAEVTVFHPEYRYAGTADAIVDLGDGRRWLIDYKTTRNDRNAQGHVRPQYPERALQLAAYRYATYAVPFRVMVPEAEQGSPRHYYFTPEDVARSVPMPEVDACAIVQLTPTGWRMIPVRAEEDARDAFLSLRAVQHFCDVIARRSVFGAYTEGGV
jgi:hypothetical protein